MCNYTKHNYRSSESDFICRTVHMISAVVVYYRLTKNIEKHKEGEVREMQPCQNGGTWQEGYRSEPVTSMIAELEMMIP